MNAVEIEEAISELALEAFDKDEFPFAFLRAFGNKETTIKRLRAGTTNKSDLGGVLQTNNIHFAVAEAGQVTRKLSELRESAATTRAKARFILSTDGAEFEAEDLVSGETVVCKYHYFPDHFGFFLPLAGISTVKQVRDSSFDIRATSRLNRLYVELLKDNPDWGGSEQRHEMNHFMARLIFCFFAEDTDIFAGESLFTDTVGQMSARDSSNTHKVIGEIFRAMNTRAADRLSEKLPRWTEQFPYVNGGLFSGSVQVPVFSKIARSYLAHIGNLDWTQINPDIFGSMIQAVADDEERGSLGMHYTSVPNILKVLNPLFLDDLREKLEEAGNSPRRLLNLRKRMARIRVFDPACGSGNFLVIAYKQMREIENAINERRGEPGRKSDIPLTNFRGIELRDFPAEIARLALIIAEYQCDVLYRGQQEALDEFLPLDNSNWIFCGNALRVDWLDLCPPVKTIEQLNNGSEFISQGGAENIPNDGEVYICGNPPYLGSKKKNKEQVEDMAIVGLSKSQLLDYVGAFIVKGLEMLETRSCSMALVATSSICQGEQVSLLWPKVFEKATIYFAYEPFKWSNSAANNAGVYCTIVGLCSGSYKNNYLYSGDKVKNCRSISPYLIEGDPVICYPSKVQISGLSKMVMGSNPVDGKRLILSSEEFRDIVKKDHRAINFIRQYGGTDEIVSGKSRWCLWINDDDLEEALSINPIKERVDACKVYREQAGRDAKKAAARPHAFCYSTFKDNDFLHVGKVIGGSIQYVPVTLRKNGYVSSDAAFAVYDTNLLEFSVIASTMHKVWAEAVSGRLGNGTRYGNTTVYNNFPVPFLTEKNRDDLRKCASSILLAREAQFPLSISEMYEVNNIPEELLEAHERNDEVLERIYIGRRFENDTERLEKMFEIYTKMTSSRNGSLKGSSPVHGNDS